MIKPFEINTKRLRLRQWCNADREHFAALNADPNVMQFFPASLDQAASDVIADQCELLIAEQGWGFWAVEILASQQFIGFVGLRKAHAQLPFAPCVELGWRLASPYWGKGYATEAATAALDFAFNQLNLNGVVAFTSMLNLPSQKVMQRLGMQRSRPNFAHPTLPLDHPLSKHCLYQLSRENLIKLRSAY